jgi:hypothetical protein
MKRMNKEQESSKEKKRSQSSGIATKKRQIAPIKKGPPLRESSAQGCGTRRKI